jgi:hypothetical protein
MHESIESYGHAGYDGQDYNGNHPLRPCILECLNNRSVNSGNENPKNRLHNARDCHRLDTMTHRTDHENWRPENHTQGCRLPIP